jgi:hypothetical protein
MIPTQKRRRKSSEGGSKDSRLIGGLAGTLTDAVTNTFFPKRRKMASDVHPNDEASFAAPITPASPPASFRVPQSQNPPIDVHRTDHAPHDKSQHPGERKKTKKTKRTKDAKKTSEAKDAKDANQATPVGGQVPGDTETTTPTLRTDTSASDITSLSMFLPLTNSQLHQQTMYNCMAVCTRLLRECIRIVRDLPTAGTTGTTGTTTRDGCICNMEAMLHSQTIVPKLARYTSYYDNNSIWLDYWATNQEDCVGAVTCISALLFHLTHRSWAGVAEEVKHYFESITQRYTPFRLLFVEFVNYVNGYQQGR